MDRGAGMNKDLLKVIAGLDKLNADALAILREVERDGLY